MADKKLSRSVANLKTGRARMNKQNWYPATSGTIQDLRPLSAEESVALIKQWRANSGRGIADFWRKVSAEDK